MPAAPLPTGGMDPSKLPTIKGECPMLATGPIMVNNVKLQAWVGAKTGGGGPMIIYWHGTGGRAATAMGELDPTLVSETMGLGGLIVSMESGQQGNPIDWGVFTTGDFEIVDQAVACAIEQLNIDASRIYTSGASAGGLAAGTLAYARSNYVAGSFPNSGGVAPWPGLNVFQNTAQIPAVFAMHGARGRDTVVIEFADSSLQLCKDTAAKGGFAVDCDHGGGHVAAPPDLKAAAWTFMKAHPFGTKPSPYAGGLPASFPMYCKIIGM
jgi:poly(3-hydroxybutyrate) depolymerase